MNKKMLISSIIIVIIFCVIFIFIYNKTGNKSIIKDLNYENIINEQMYNEVTKVKEIYIKVNNSVLTVKLNDNESTNILIEKLKEKDVTVDAREYGEFEKVGNLGFNLPQSDEYINTESGDIMLYQGNKVTIFYGSNSWSYTRLGKIQNVSNDELKNILGNENIKLTFSLNK